MQYDYRSMSTLTAQECEERLRKYWRNKKILSTYPTYNGEFVSERCEALGFPLIPFYISHNEYNDYFNKVNYIANYPDYYSSNIYEKSLEHYIALTFLSIKQTDIVIDIAAEGSPLHDIISKLFNAFCYAQDIMYQEGIHNNKIGSDACKIPLDDMSVNKIMLCCSLEHFENNADIKLIIECERLLCRGGKLVIAPLYLHSDDFTQTDPVFSVNNVIFDDARTILIEHGWNNRHGRWYSPDTLFQRLVSNTRYFNFEIFEIKNKAEIHDSVYINNFLVLTKI